jgi:hypothetical protein
LRLRKSHDGSFCPEHSGELAATLPLTKQVAGQSGVEVPAVSLATRRAQPAGQVLPCCAATLAGLERFSSAALTSQTPIPAGFSSQTLMARRLQTFC